MARASFLPAPLPAITAPASVVTTTERAEAAAAVAPAPSDAEGASWPDESVESAFLAEARDRGEPIARARAQEDIADETDAKALPPLSELVNRIPAEVREALEDLFRARFVTVKRVPKRALKS